VSKDEIRHHGDRRRTDEVRPAGIHLSAGSRRPGIEQADPSPGVSQELRVLGSYDYTWFDFEKAMELIASGRVRTAPLITHRFPLARIQEGILKMGSREAIKVILTP
jgi:threonine dehydrogenase-like Zn-dependent dehydrogenase